MNKRLYSILALGGAGILAAGVYIASMNFPQPAVKTEASAAKSAPQENKSNHSSKISADNLGIDPNSSEIQVVEVMHKMTHQKVKADPKWGAIVMKKDTISKIYEILKNSEFKDKKNLLAIAERWKSGNFQNVVEDHNYFWKLQGGTVGKAYGKLDHLEEQTFCLNNFGDKITIELEKSGEL
ncbi:DUF6241 domain-containing protein [Metabacillus sp. RGM 3146]|uniref:DUF6241 domain-containing protein n=1 Tax=Metabacillus sp. RGM 3146 TaxID=3401092 RepID=UPI003B9AA7D1